MLRWLDLPCVVRLLDEGLHRGRPFLVTALAPGGPWPGPLRSGEQLQEALVELLRAVSQLHASGVVHGDLKPQNLRVDDHGQLRLLDFGLSVWTTTAPPAAGLTLPYAAPELLEGHSPSPASDAYAIGRMLSEVLAETPSGQAVLYDLAQALCQESPERRPSLHQALCLLGISAPDWSGLLDALPPVAHPLDLRPLFTSEPCFTQRGQRAAHQLWEAAAGDPAQLPAVLERWGRAGLLHRHPSGELELSERSLRRLEAQGAVTGLPSADTPHLWARALHQQARACLERSQLSLAQGLLDLALEASIGAPELQRRLLHDRAAAALSCELDQEIDAALLQLDRSGLELPSLRWLLVSAQALARRERDRGAELVQHLAPFSDPELELWRAALLVNVAALRGPDAHRLQLDALRPWAAQSPRFKAKWRGWEGRLRYQQGDYLGALLAHQDAARSKRPHEQVSALANALAAAVELPEQGWPLADALHEAASRCAAQAGMAKESLRLRRLHRGLRYRQGVDLEPALEWLPPAFALSQLEGALLALTEASFLYRQGPPELCAQVAGQAADAFQGVGAEKAAALARALVAACGHPLSREQRRSLHQELARGRGVPELDLQIAALMAQGGLSPVTPSRSSPVAASQPDRRLDLLSWREAQRLLGTTAPIPPPPQPSPPEPR